MDVAIKPRTTVMLKKLLSERQIHNIKRDIERLKQEGKINWWKKRVGKAEKTEENKKTSVINGRKKSWKWDIICIK